MSKRADYLSWDEYFMGIAFLSGMRSKDPSTQVGACIIDEDKKIIGIGYNGFPIGSSDDNMPWDKAIVQSGIKKVIYFSDKHKSLDSTKASRRIFENAGVKTEHLKMEKEKINIIFKD